MKMMETYLHESLHRVAFKAEAGGSGCLPNSSSGGNSAASNATAMNVQRQRLASEDRNLRVITMRDVSDRQLWAWIVGEPAAERLAGIPIARIEQLGAGDLMALPGVGPHRARAILAVAELARRFAAAPAPRGMPFASSRDVVAYYSRRLAHEDREHCYVMALDARNRLLAEMLVSVGGLTGAAVEPRDFFVPVIRERAAAAIVVHNHPSGNAEPSKEDLTLASNLKTASRILGIRLLDFVIVGRDESRSFRDMGLLTDVAGAVMAAAGETGAQDRKA